MIFFPKRGGDLLDNGAIRGDAGVKKPDDILQSRGYRRMRCIGEGSSGKIWLVLYAATGELRVAKNVEDVKERIADLRLWAGLDHPGLSNIYDIIPNGRDAICIMEYIQGQNLRDYVQEYRTYYGNLSEIRAAGWGIELCGILGYLHKQNPAVIYQDLKPSNIILTAEGRLRLIDPDSAGVARMGARVMGTPGFLAPEQQKGEIADEQADIYGLGRTLIWILGSTEKGKVRAGPGMRHVLAKCTEAEKEKRFSDCGKLAEALRETIQIKNRMCIFCCVVAAAVLGLGGVQISAEKAHRQEEKYQFYLNQKNISDYKSAIFLFPDREEGYQQFLDYILEDDVMDREEHRELSSVLHYTEASFRENKESYEAFACRLGMIYWFQYADSGGRRYAGAWFKKVLELGVAGDMDGKKICAEVFCTIAEYYDLLEYGEDTIQMDYQKFWKEGKRLLALPLEEEDNPAAILRLCSELAGFMYQCKTEFMNHGVSRDEWERMILLFEEKEDEAVKLSAKDPACMRLQAELKRKLEVLISD